MSPETLGNFSITSPTMFLVWDCPRRFLLSYLYFYLLQAQIFVYPRVSSIFGGVSILPCILEHTYSNPYSHHLLYYSRLPLIGELFNINLLQQTFDYHHCINPIFKLSSIIIVSDSSSHPFQLSFEIISNRRHNNRFTSIGIYYDLTTI